MTDKNIYVWNCWKQLILYSFDENQIVQNEYKSFKEETLFTIKMFQVHVVWVGKKRFSGSCIISLQIFWINPSWRLSKCNCGLGKGWDAENWMSHKCCIPFHVGRLWDHRDARAIAGCSVSFLGWRVSRVCSLWSFLPAIISSWNRCTNCKQRLEFFTAALEDWDSH